MLSWIPTSERTPRRIAFTHSKGDLVCCHRMHRVGTLGREPHWATPSERAEDRAERASPERERVVPQSPPAKRNRLGRTCRPQPASGTVGADPARSPPNTRVPTPAARGRRWFGPDGRSVMGVQSHTRFLSRAFRAFESTELPFIRFSDAFPGGGKIPSKRSDFHRKFLGGQPPARAWTGVLTRSNLRIDVR